MEPQNHLLLPCDSNEFSYWNSVNGGIDVHLETGCVIVIIDLNMQVYFSRKIRM